jgi:DNA-directed RNA polymerase subunit RPC12/RpoP
LQLWEPMEKPKIKYFEKAECPRHQDFILEQNNCVLCGEELVLEAVNLENGEVEDKARCPHCLVLVRSHLHLLQ